MTREEYKKKYGKAPPVSNTSIVNKISKPLSSGADTTAMQTKPKKDLLDTVLGAGSDVAEFIGAGGISEQYGASLAEAFAKPENKRYVEHPSMKKVLGSAIQTGALLAPGAGTGAGLATRVAVGGATGYALDVGSNLQKDEPVLDALKPGIGTAVGVALPILGKIVGDFPRAMEQASLRMTPTERINLKKQGKDVADYLAKKKIVGTPDERYAKIDGLYDKMEEVIASKMRGSGVVYSKTDIIDALRSIPDQFKDDLVGYEDATKGVESVLNAVQKQAPEQIPAELLNKYKRTLFKRAYSKNNTDVLNETYHAAASVLKDKLDESVSGLQTLNQEYGLLLTARKILLKATERAQTGFADRTLGTVGGALIGGTFGPVGAAVGAIGGEKASKVLGSTAVRSATGATVQTFIDVVNKLPVDKAGNLQIAPKALILMIQDALKSDTQ